MHVFVCVRVRVRVYEYVRSVSGYDQKDYYHRVPPHHACSGGLSELIL
jgi:hypothetical protein